MNRSTDELGMIGDALATAMNLKRDPEHKDRWLTIWGTKRGPGLYLTLKRWIEQVETTDDSTRSIVREIMTP